MKVSSGRSRRVSPHVFEQWQDFLGRAGCNSAWLPRSAKCGDYVTKGSVLVLGLVLLACSANGQTPATGTITIPDVPPNGSCFGPVPTTWLIGVNGVVANYVQGSPPSTTTAQVAQNLANSVNAQISFITASASGNVITLTTKETGSAVNYPFGGEVSYGAHLVPISVCLGVVSPLPASGPTLTGGTDAAVQGYINPKYMIVGITYAPPGSQSYVQYTDTSAIGNTTGISSSLMDQTSLSISVGGSAGIQGYFEGSATGTYTHTYGQTSSSSNTVTIMQTTGVSDLTRGPTNSFAGLDHDLDVIWLWLNPVLPFSFPPSNPLALTWNGYGYDASDPAGPFDIYPVSVGWLNGDIPVPSDVAAVLARTWASGLVWAPGTGPGLTGPGPGTDFANIVEADPFWQCTPAPANCPTTVDPTRFTLSDNQPAWYQQAAVGGQPYTYGYNYQYSNTSMQGQMTSTTDSQAFGLDVSFSVGSMFNKITTDFKDTHTLTWTTSVNTSVTHTTSTVATASITGPTCTVVNGACSPVYNGPSEFGIYQDNQYGTFMFFPIGETSGAPLSLPASITVPGAMSGLPYGPEVLTATGGSGTGYAWCVQSGAQCVQSGPPLPPGFNLSSKSNCGNFCTEVTLSSTGNPVAPVGPYPFTVQVTDSAGNIATEPMSVTITQGPTNVTGQVAITSSGLAYSRVSQTFNGSVTVKNIGATAIGGPLQVLFVGMPATVTLINASGSVSTTPYMTIPAMSGLAPDQSITVNVEFKNPSNGAIHLTPAVYSGSIN